MVQSYPARMFSVTVIMSLFSSLSAQLYVPPDHKGQIPSAGTCWFSNDGQVGDDNGDPATDVLYESFGQWLTTYLCRENKVVFSLPATDGDTTTQDTLYNFSMQLVGENVDPGVLPEPAEEVSWTHNYYRPWCPQGITGVRGYHRIIYASIYPGIDMHMYSNIWGYKLYFVVHPGGNPADIVMMFNGQDSISEYDDDLRVYQGERGFEFPQALAYQHIGSGTVQVPWYSTYEEIDEDLLVSFGLGSYDTDYPLILDISAGFGMPPPPPPPTPPAGIPEWASFYGAGKPDGEELVRTTALTNGGMATCGATWSGNFPTFLGVDPTYNGGTDAFYSVFNDQYHLEYATFYGGSAWDRAYGITQYGSGFAIVGMTKSASDLTWSGPPGSFVDDVGNQNIRNCFVAAFDDDGLQIWATLFGLEYRTIPANIDTYTTAVGQGLVIGGTLEWIWPSSPCPVEMSCASPTMDAFPICGSGSAYLQSAMGWHFMTTIPPVWKDGWFAKFDEEFQLAWSTIFGGSSYLDEITDLVVDPVTNHLIAVGSSWSPYSGATCQAPVGPNLGYPMCFLSTGYYQSMAPAGLNDEGEQRATIAEFDQDNALTWSTAFGATALQWTRATAVDARFGRIAVLGYTTADTYSSSPCATPGTFTGEFPSCTSSIPYQGLGVGPWNNDVVFAAQFSTATKALTWSSFIPKVDALDIAIGGEGSVFMTGQFDVDAPMQWNPDYFSVVAAPQGGDGWVGGFDGTGLFYGAEYAGADYDEPNNIVATGTINDIKRVYVGGTTMSTHLFEQFPYQCPATVDPWCVSYMAVPRDLFYVQLKQDVLLSIGIDESNATGTSNFTLYPNPSNGLLTAICTGDLCDDVRAVSLFDACGREVLKKGFTPDRAISLGALASGAYVVQLMDANAQVLYTGKLILQP